MKHTFNISDNEAIEELEPDSIELIVTSPPYVTTEFKKGQEFDYDGFLSHFESLCQKLFRVTVPGGRFALNVADIITKYRYDDEKTISRIPLGSDLFQICQKIGWRLLERYIWDKGFTRNFGGPLLGSYPYPLSIFNNNYFEYIFVLRKPGARKVKQPLREESRVSLEEWRLWSQNWWRVESESEKINYHRAVFPIEIPLRLIRMYSYVGDNILDPYAGTGSTAIAAHLANRSSISYEIDAECRTWLERRVGKEIPGASLEDLNFFIKEKGA